MIRLALLAVVATVPFAIERVYMRLSLSQAYYLKMAGLSVVMLAIGLMVILRLPLRRPTTLLWCYLAYLVVILVSILARPVYGYGLAEAILPLTGAGFLLALEMMPSRRRWQESAFLLLVGVGAISAAYGILQNFGFEILPRPEPETERQVLVSFFGHSNFMASFLGPILFLAAYFIEPKRGWLAIFAIATVAAILLCLFLAGTRAATVAAIAGAISLIRLRPPHIRFEQKRLLAVIGLAIVVVAAFTFGGQRWGRHRETLMRRFSSHREIRNRVFLWLIAIDMIQHHPLLGIGYGRYDTEFWPYCERYVKRPGNEIYRYILREMRGVNPGQAHNDLLEAASETGVFGTAAFLSIWVTMLILCTRCVRRGPPAEQRMARYLRAALIFMFLDAQFGFPLQLPASAMVFWILLGNVAQTYRRAERSWATATTGEVESAGDLAAVESQG